MAKQVIGSVDDALARSFKVLAVKKPIEKITIKEITDMAGVIRPTFYNHFQDKYELLEWIVRTQLMEPCEAEFLQGHLEEGVMGFFAAVKEDRDFYESCARLTGQNSFADILKNEVKSFILKHIGEDSLKKHLWYEWLTPTRAADFFAESITYAVTVWIKSGMKIPEAEIWECFSYLVSHSILEMILGVALDKD